MATAISFGDANSGFQAGIINGSVHAEFRLPHGTSGNARKAAVADRAKSTNYCSLQHLTSSRFIGKSQSAH